MPNFGIVEKPVPVEKDSPLLGYMDQWIAWESENVKPGEAKAYTEETFKSVKEARKFQSDIQLAARQRDRGFRTTKFVVTGKDGSELAPNEDGKYTDADVKSVAVGGTLGDRKKRNGTANAAAATE